MADMEIQQASRASLKPQAAEVFRGLWASLFYSQANGLKSVLVCSADRQEGASTTACSLALAGSEPAGAQRVALVDLNLRTPALDQMLGCKNAPGVGEIVLEGLPADQAAQPVGPGLDFYAVGKVGANLLEILRSDALGQFLRALEAKYDHVVVDAAAANQYPDAQILAPRVGNALLVAYASQTPREAVALAKKRIESGGAKVVGVVLNQRTYPIPKFLYRRV